MLDAIVPVTAKQKDANASSLKLVAIVNVTIKGPVPIRTNI